MRDKSVIFLRQQCMYVYLISQWIQLQFLFHSVWLIQVVYIIKCTYILSIVCAYIIIELGAEFSITRPSLCDNNNNYIEAVIKIIIN